MKVSVYAVLGHMVLSTLLWILGNIDTAPWCHDGCDTLSYIGAIAFLFIVYPGLAVVEYATLAPGTNMTGAQWFASAIGTEILLFVLVLVIVKGVMNAGKLK